jgi:hypothetical protein
MRRSSGAWRALRRLPGGPAAGRRSAGAPGNAPCMTVQLDCTKGLAIKKVMLRFHVAEPWRFNNS